MSIWNKNWYVFPAKFRGKRMLIYVLYIIIVASFLYLARTSDAGFLSRYWFLILLVPYIAYHAWIEEELDKE